MNTSAQLDHWLSLIFVVTAVIYALRSIVGVLLLSAQALPGRAGALCHQAGGWMTPRLVRRLIAATVGLCSLSPAVAFAATSTPNVDLDRVPSISASTTPAPTAAAQTSATHITVKPGDCLWGLAADQLDSRDPDAIDRQWRRWYQANRSTIGADPNELTPGMRLVIPAGKTAQR